MNRYRNCSVTIIRENNRVYNVTCYVDKNAIRLFGSSAGLTPYRDFESTYEIKCWVFALCKQNYLKPRKLAEDFEAIMYDINWIDITRPFEISRLYSIRHKQNIEK